MDHIHTRIVGVGIHEKVEQFPVKCIPWEIAKTAPNREGKVIEIPGTKEVGFMCPRCKRIFRTKIVEAVQDISPIVTA